MNSVLVVFASVATANRVKSILSKNFGINSFIIQTPKALSSYSGCSYCLRLSREHMNTVWKIVTSNGLSSKGIFDAQDYTKLK